MITKEIHALAESLGQRLSNQKMTVTTAESCTAGGLSFAITAIPGSSSWFHESFVTYSNHAKTALLGVSDNILTTYGAVSGETALAMVEGVRKRTAADLALSITGIAGPGGGSVEKPVGLVWFGFQTARVTLTKQQIFSGDRAQIRLQAIRYALEVAVQLTE